MRAYGSSLMELAPNPTPNLHKIGGEIKRIIIIISIFYDKVTYQTSAGPDKVKIALTLS